MTNINPIVFQEDNSDGIGCITTGVKILPIVNNNLFPFQLNCNVDSSGVALSSPVGILIDNTATTEDIVDNTDVSSILHTRQVIFLDKYSGTEMTDSEHSTLGTTYGYGFSIGSESNTISHVELLIQGVYGYTPSSFTLEVLSDNIGTVERTVTKTFIISSSSPTKVVFELPTAYNSSNQKYIRIYSTDGQFNLIGSTKSDYDNTSGVQTPPERYTKQVIQGADVYSWADDTSDQSHGAIKLYGVFDGRRYNSLTYDGLDSLSIANGTYRLKIIWGSQYWYSEWFSVKNNLEGLSKITYWHNEPIYYNDRRKPRHIDFSNGFKYWWYLNNDVGGEEVEYVFRENRNDGYRYVQRIDSEIFHRHFTVLRKEEFKAFRLIPIHHNVEVITQDGDLIYVDKMTMGNEWNDINYTEVEIEYYSDTVFSTTNKTIESSLKGEYSDDYSADYNI